MPKKIAARFLFDNNDEDFEAYKQEFSPKNTLGDTQKCLHIASIENTDQSVPLMYV